MPRLPTFSWSLKFCRICGAQSAIAFSGPASLSLKILQVHFSSLQVCHPLPRSSSRAYLVGTSQSGEQTFVPFPALSSDRHRCVQIQLGGGMGPPLNLGHMVHPPVQPHQRTRTPCNPQRPASLGSSVTRSGHFGPIGQVRCSAHSPGGGHYISLGSLGGDTPSPPLPASHSPDPGKIGNVQCSDPPDNALVGRCYVDGRSDSAVTLPTN